MHITSLQSAALPLPTIFKKTAKKVRRKQRDPKWLTAAYLGAASSGLCALTAAFRTIVAFTQPELVSVLSSSAQLIVTWNQIANTKKAIQAFRGYDLDDTDFTPNRSLSISQMNIGHCNMNMGITGVYARGLDASNAVGLSSAVFCYWAARNLYR